MSGNVAKKSTNPTKIIVYSTDVPVQNIPTKNKQYIKSIIEKQALGTNNDKEEIRCMISMIYFWFKININDQDIILVTLKSLFDLMPVVRFVWEGDNKISASLNTSVGAALDFLKDGESTKEKFYNEGLFLSVFGVHYVICRASTQLTSEPDRRAAELLHSEMFVANTRVSSFFNAFQATMKGTEFARTNKIYALAGIIAKCSDNPLPVLLNSYQTVFGDTCTFFLNIKDK